MFSGEAPFKQFSNQILISALIWGERPPRLFHTLSNFCGLNDNMWHLIETCWHQDAGKRPVAAQIIEFLCLFPRAVDTRPLDVHVTPQPQMWYKQDEHSFCALAPGPQDTDMLKGLKQNSAGPADSSLLSRPLEMGVLNLSFQRYRYVS